MLKPNMPSRLVTKTTSSKPTFFFPIAVVLMMMMISFLLGLSHASITAAYNKTTLTIGAIINASSRSGKEQKIAMQIAIHNFNRKSRNHKLSLHLRNPDGDPLRAAYAAEELIKENQVQVIIGMETWNEAALVAEVGNRAQVPILSFAAASITPPLMQHRWPFLVQMAANSSEQMGCIAAILHSFNWKSVIAIYEDDVYGTGDSGTLSLLSEQLQGISAEIEYRLVLPPFSSLSDPQGFVQKEVAKLLYKQSRLFVVLHSSLSMAAHLFKEANELGLMGRDSVWIITDTVSSLLDSVNNSVISSMQGAIGIKPYYSENSVSFLNFKGQFQKIFRMEYPEEDDSVPGIHALRAYYGITTIGQALRRLDHSQTSTSKMLLEKILSSNYTGLSGDIHFRNGGLLSNSSLALRIMNVIGRKFKDTGFWASEFGFSDRLSRGRNGSGDGMEVLADSVIWPGNLKRVPKGWAMPSDAKPMKIGVPGRTSFEKFVRVVEQIGNSKQVCEGFCIDVFIEVQKVLEQNYFLPYEFVPYNGTYDDLVHHVVNKTFDAIIGDVTILANRARYVTFTQPFAESGLSMLVPVKPEAHKEWMFMKPFTTEMWIVTGAILIYTMAIVWFLEHQYFNPEFRGPWKNQLGTALWFTFSSLFFAHREKIHSNLTRLVVVVWLFVVLVLNSSYTASLTSMLTVSRLEPNVTDIEWLKKTNAPVGCDGDSFVWNYLQDVLRFNSNNIKNISTQYEYPGQFDSSNITAAFLEVPYAKVFLKEYCNKYTVSGPTYRFGGLGFVFQKGSPIATDVSEAILTLSENGKLKHLEEKWFSSSLVHCSDTETTKTDNLSLQSFWHLYLISGATSTICFLFFLLRLLKNYVFNEGNTSAESDNSVWSFLVRLLKNYVFNEGNTSAESDNSVWRKTVELVKCFNNGGSRSIERAQTPDADEWSSSRWDFASPSDSTTEQSQTTSPPAEIDTAADAIVN